MRIGDTSIVCGVRGEILLASDIPLAPNEDADDEDLVEELGLLVPNLELSTGCSPAHLPGNPPSTLAQSLSYRISSLLHTSGMIGIDDLRIQYLEPHTDEDLPDEGPRVVTKAYWTLYIDILCIALDGNAFDAAWAAVIAALSDATLPKARWEPDRETVLCSPRLNDLKSLQMRTFPVAASFVVYSTASPLKNKEEAEQWILADPDAFEEDVCTETLTVIVSIGIDHQTNLLRLEKSGGSSINDEQIMQCAQQAVTRLKDWSGIFGKT